MTTRTVPLKGRGQSLALILLIIVGSMLAVMTVIAKAGAGEPAHWSPIALLVWGNLGGGLIQLAYALSRGHKPSIAPDHLRYNLGSGVLFAIPNILLFAAVIHVGAGVTTLTLAFPLILTYLGALALGMEKPHVTRIAGVLAGLVGGLVITFGSSAGYAVSPWLVLALLAPVGLAAGNLFRTRFWPEGAHALQLSPVMLIVGGTVTLGFALVAGVPLTPPAWSNEAMAAVAALIAINATLFIAYFNLQRIAGPVYLSQIGLVAAIVGPLLAMTLLGEQLGLHLALAGGFILLGILLVNRRKAD